MKYNTCHTHINTQYNINMNVNDKKQIIIDKLINPGQIPSRSKLDEDVMRRAKKITQQINLSPMTKLTNYEISKQIRSTIEIQAESQ